MEKNVKIMFQNASNAVPVEAVLTMEAPEDLPDGTTGYMLVKTADGVDWAAIPVEIPAEGTTGYVLTKTATGYEWAAVPVEVPAEGTEGYVLTKTADGYAWVTPVAQVPALPETDGEYKLVITEGVATWVSLT